jgi:hypothetical protein
MEDKSKNTENLLGSKKIWQSFNNLSEKDNQILRNSGYITIMLVSVTYASENNFLQKILSGTDKVALSTSVIYGVGTDAIESTAVQDITEVRSGKTYLLGKERILAEKIPANANSLSINIKLTAVKDDLLKAKFEMLNKPEYQSGLKLLPGVVGQVLTITSLVRGLFSDSSDQPYLEGNFAGTIAQDSNDQPVSKGELTQGLLFMINSDNNNNFATASGNDFFLDGNTLLYKNKPILNTNVVLRVTFDKNKGENEQANWSKKYRAAISSLDKLELLVEKDEEDKIKKDAINTWIEGNALLDTDDTYINAEKLKIKATALTAIKNKFNLTQAGVSSLKEFAAKPFLTNAIINGLTTTDTDLSTVTDALPSMSNLLFNKQRENFNIKTFQSESMSEFPKAELLLNSLAKDSNHYLDMIGKQEGDFKF